MSATMALLKGGKNKKPETKPAKAKAKPAQDDTDAELAEDEVQVDTTDKDEGSDQVDGDGNDVELETSEEGAAELDASNDAVAIPTSKTEVHALKMADLPGVHEALGSPIAGFDELDLKGKKNALLEHLFPKGGKAKIAVAGSDTLTKVSGEIENLKTRAEVEDELDKLMQSEGETAFRKGGLLVKLSEIGDFGEHASLRDYILANGIAKDYRTARYWMELYTGLLEIGIPYADVEEIGWTKILILLKVLTKENLDEWKKKALAMNVATLKATVDASEAAGNKPGTSQSSGPSEIKSMVFKFHKDQTETANDAIAKAKKVAGTEVKEVAADLIFTEYLATATNKKPAKKEAPAKAAGYDIDNLDVGAFFKGIKERFPDTKEAMAFLFQDAPDDEQADPADPKAYFEVIWPEVQIDVKIP
jgi:hypothetical protein